MTISHRESVRTFGGSTYSVERELGRGGMAVVYLARDRKHDRWVALKVLRPELAASLLAERFLREIRIAAGLSHPHILPLHDSGETHGLLYYVMPFVEGESLRQRLNRDRPLPVGEALRIAGEVASALDYAHRRGVVHRDIKPENILLEEGHAVVADFGVARALVNATDDTLTEPGIRVGTAAYMSPEQAAGERDVDGRSDIYSLGCVLFEMLAGEQPFRGPNAHAVIAARFTGTPPSARSRRPDVPAVVDDVVRRALASEPAARFATAAQLAAALAQGARSVGGITETPAASEVPLSPGSVSHQRTLPKSNATAFVGREDAIARVKELLEQDRLVTILGPGGVGKSRLALEIASGEGSYRDRCHVVPLAAVTSPQYLAASIAEALGLGAAGGRDPRLQLLGFLRRRNMLLVLDNFEHLVAGGALVSEMVEGAPKLRVLVTSRQRLNLQRETVYELGALGVPAGGDVEAARRSPAVRLFLAHARRYRPDVQSWDAEMPAIVRICRSVDGLPLGIEIAAALLRALSCQEIAAELEGSLDSLVTPLRDVPERHRSLRAVFEQSWTLLDAAERESLAKLSVFQGSFERTAGEHVAGASLPVLIALIDKSLLTRAGASRYQLHEVVRQYSAAKSRAMPAIRTQAEAAHAAYFAAYTRTRQQRLTGGGQQAALEEIAAELGNIRAGWKWAQDNGDDDLLAAYGEGLYRYYNMRGWFREGAEDLGIAERLDRGSVVVGQLLAWYGAFCWRLGLTAKARGLFRRSLLMLRHFGAEAATVIPLRGLANIATDLGKYRAADRLHRQCVGICRAVGDRHELALSLNNWSIALMELGRYDEVEARLRESMEIHKEIGDTHGVAVCLLNLANALETQDKLGEVRRPLEEGLALARQLGSRLLIAAASLNLGHLILRFGQSGEAERLLQESVEQFREIGVRDGLTTALLESGNAALTLGKYDQAASLFREALTSAVEIDATALTVRVLLGMADLFSRTGERDRALSLLSAVLHHPAIRESDLPRARALLAQVAAESATATVSSVGQRTSARDLQTILGSLLAE